MKKLANLTGVKVLGKSEQKSIHGGASASCGGTPCSTIGSRCKYICNGYLIQGLCTSQGCQPL